MTLLPESAVINILTRKALKCEPITFREAQTLLSSSDIISLASGANTITRAHNGDVIDVETLINAKSGGCPEDCSFCAQSSFYNTAISKYPLLSKEIILERAQEAKKQGASSFCLVCAYRYPPEKDFQSICQIIEEIKKQIDIEVNASLGFMNFDRVRKLKDAGVKRYNHNLETSESFFAQICRTHDFADRMNTARIVKAGGLELCCGGIIGMGETSDQRLELAFAIASLAPDEVPINILIANDGTPLAHTAGLDPVGVIKTIAVWRFIMPKTILKIAGGREFHLKDSGRFALKAGANGIITGGYLTKTGNESHKDILMINELGLKI